ncbi:zinc finger BED domain-containing protein 1-like, partial [Aphis craccivora]
GKLCMKNVKTSGNTTNLKTHVMIPMQHHKKVLLDNVDDPTVSNIENTAETDKEATKLALNERLETNSQDEPPIKKRNIQVSIDPAFHSVQSFSEGEIKYAKLSNALLFMLVKDGLPLSITEKQGFKEYCKIATPHFKLPSTICRMLGHKYEIIENALKKVLSSRAYITLITDVWTDTMNSKSYLGVTVHFINNKEIMSGMLDVYPLSERHTADYLAEMLMEVQNKWNITSSKVVCVVSDGAPNIVKAINDTYGDHKHFYCFAHVLNLIPQKAISNIPTLVSLLTKIKQIVTFFTHSVVACDKPISLQLQDGTDKESILKLKQEVLTRWNSTFYMLERFKLLAFKISMVLPDLSLITERNKDDGNDLWSYHKQVTSNHSNGIASIASSNSNMELELRQYLDLPLVNIDENVLEVWETF